MRRVLLSTALCSTVAGIAFVSGAIAADSPKPACAVTGVWELESVMQNGKAVPPSGFRQRKVVTKHHWMWVGQSAHRDTLPLRSAIDTLRRNELGGGAGTWTLAGNAYTEHIEYFNDPGWIGKDWKATCRVDGGRWYHSFEVPATSDTSGSAARNAIVEEWRRIE